MLAGTALGTMWLYTDPMFFQIGSRSHAGSYTPANVSLLEVVNSPYFYLFGQSFYNDAIPVQVRNASNTVQIGTKGVSSPAPVQVTFGGHLESNLLYAQTKSSLRIGQQGSWGTLNTPGVV